MVTVTDQMLLEASELAKAGRYEEALAKARTAASASGDVSVADAMVGSILLQLDRIEEAVTNLQAAADRGPPSADVCSALADVAFLAGAYELANSIYHRAVLLAPESAKSWYSLAASHRGLGRLEAAVDACTRAIALKPDHYQSYQMRSELARQTADSNHVDALRGVLRRFAGDPRCAMYIGYALAKELDDLERYDEAFGFFMSAAKARRTNLRYDVAVDEMKMARIAQVFSDAPPPQAAPVRHDGRHIFILGLPRSGTTLLERIATGLPGISTNGETDNFANALLKAAPADSGDVFARAARADPNLVAQLYEEKASIGHSSDRIVEKLPMNYLYLGFIAKTFPTAPIILLKRAPVDACFAMFRTLFGTAYPFSYDFDDLARYYRAFETLMNHWRKVLPGRLIEIGYDDLVADPAGVGATLARDIGTEWSDAAIDIRENANVSLTASAAQVRAPIHRKSSGRWRKYESHLAPLSDALKRAGVANPDRL